MEEIQKISAYGKSKFTKPNKLAVVASDNLAYGEMRALMAYRAQPELSAAQVFRTEQDALEWLRK